MSGKLLRNQADISNQTPMPTDRLDDSSTVSDISAETLTWFYSNSGVWASATGQAAGTIVTGALTYDGVLNSIKAVVGHADDTSFSLAAATRFDTLIKVPESLFDQIQHMNVEDQVATITPFLSTNGYYAIDHRRGQVWGIAKDTVADDSASYSVKAPVTGGSVGSTSTESEGDTAHDAADSGNPVKVGGTATANEPTAVDEGDRVQASYDLEGNARVRSKAYDAGSQADKSLNLNPEYTHYVKEIQTFSNVANATPVFGYVNMEGYRGCSIHVEKTGGSDTFDVDYESSNEGSDSSSDWIDTTATWTITGGATADHMAYPNEQLKAVAHRFEITTAGGGDDADFNVFVYKWS